MENKFKMGIVLIPRFIALNWEKSVCLMFAGVSQPSGLRLRIVLINNSIRDNLLRDDLPLWDWYWLSCDASSTVNCTVLQAQIQFIYEAHKSVSVTTIHNFNPNSNTEFYSHLLYFH